MVTVECDDCMVTTWTYGDAHEAIAAWNRRASPDEHLLRKAAEALTKWSLPYEERAALAAELRQRMGRGK
jgi:hypothetical protein